MDLKNKQTLNRIENVKEPVLVRPRNIARLIFILILLNMTTFNCGYNIAYITALGASNLTLIYGNSITIPVIRAFCIASVPFGVSLGTFLAIFIVPLTTRRRLTLLLALIGLILGGIVQVQNLIVFFICRLFQGTITGIYLILVPIYVREISPKQINKKGVFGVMPMLFVALGIMMAFVLNTIFIELSLDEMIRWRIIISLNLIVIATLIMCIFLGVIPQSPNSLISQGEQEDTKRVIGIFHAERFVEEIYKEKLQEVEAAKKVPPPPQNVNKKLALQKAYLTFLVPIMQQLTGVNAYISQMGFVTQAFNYGFGSYFPAIMGTVQFGTALFSMFFFYRFQRRKMILIGNLGTALSCFMMGIPFYFISTFQNGFWIVVTGIIVFMAFNGTFLIPSVPLYIPTAGTKVQLQYTQVSNWFSCGVAVVLLPIINAYFTFSTMFFTYGTITLIFFIINYFLMVQPKIDIRKIVNDELKQIQLKSVFARQQEQGNTSWRNM